MRPIVGLTQREANTMPLVGGPNHKKKVQGVDRHIVATRDQPSFSHHSARETKTAL